MDIDGMGEEAVVWLHDAGLLTNVADVYELNLSRLVEVPLFARNAKAPLGDAVIDIVVPSRNAEKLLAAIATSKDQPFARVLYALGIPHVGFVTAQALVEHFGSMDDLEAAGEEQIAEVPGIGPVVASAVRQYLADERNRQTLATLRASGLRFVEEAPRRAAGPFSGRTFVLTGRLESMTRPQAAAAIEALGGRTSDSVSKATSYVVAGEDPGSKLAKAQKAGVTVLDEPAFLELLADADDDSASGAGPLPLSEHG
jgi:DNA ligase (NAD+)